MRALCIDDDYTAAKQAYPEYVKYVKHWPEEGRIYEVKIVKTEKVIITCTDCGAVPNKGIIGFKIERFAFLQDSEELECINLETVKQII